MPVDPNISFQSQPLQTGEVTRQANQDQQQSALSAEQLLAEHYKNMSTRDQSRLRSTVVGAAQLKTYLDKGDVEGAHDFLMQRQSALHSRMGNGEDVDDQETAYAIQKLRNGDVEGLQNDISAILTAGQAYNMIGGEGLPSSVREWQYYNSLPDAQKKEWLTNKRAGSNIDLGGSVVRLGADGKPEAGYNKTLAPADQPANAGAKSEASAAGNARGAEQGAAEAKLAAIQSQIPNFNKVLTKLDKLSDTATYTKAGVAGNEVARQLGAKVPQGAVDRTAYITTIDNEVLPLLRQTFGAAFTAEEGNRLKATLGDPNLSPPEKKAALQSFWDAKMGEVESLQRQTGQAPNGGLIKVSNGKETYNIKPEDFGAAQAEGFQQVQ